MSETHIFIGRQPIFDKKGQLTAYELLFRENSNKNSAGIDNPEQATEAVINNAILGFGLDELVGPHKAYINFPESFFHAEVDPPFSPEFVVIEVLEDVRPTPEVIAGLHQLKALGYTIALDDFIFKKEFIPFLKLADIIKLELNTLSHEKITLLTTKIRKVTQARLLAEKVETQAVYNACLEGGFDLFQGYFFAKPDIVKAKNVAVGKLNLMLLLQKISDPNINLDDLKLIVEQDVGLSHKLLKMALQYRQQTMPEFETIKEVMMLFGLKRVQSWTTMLSMTSVDDVVPEVFVMALSRAIFMREVAIQDRLAAVDSYYLTGLLSLLDVITHQPLEKVLNELPLNPAMIEGILQQKGDYWRILNMAKSFENATNQSNPSEYSILYLQSFKEARNLLKLAL